MQYKGAQVCTRHLHWYTLNERVSDSSPRLPTGTYPWIPFHSHDPKILSSYRCKYLAPPGGVATAIQNNASSTYTVLSPIFRLSDLVIEITSTVVQEEGQGLHPHEFGLLNFFRQSIKFGQMLFAVSMSVRYCHHSSNQSVSH